MLRLGRPFDGKIVFYSSLFQAGVDRIVIVDQADNRGLTNIPAKRLHVLSIEAWTKVEPAIDKYFEYYLQPGWQRKPEYDSVVSLYYFLRDLLISVHLGQPLLTTLPLPDLAPLQVTIPLEILSLVQMLLGSAHSYESIVALPTFQVSQDRVDVIDEIMASSTYKEREKKERA